MNYMVVQVTLPGIQNLGWRFWIIWAVICFSFIPITYFLYPETANRTLEDIDRYFEMKPPIFIHRDKLATQLSRPAIFIEEDARFARMQEESEKEEKSSSVGLEEHVEDTPAKV